MAQQRVSVFATARVAQTGPIVGVHQYSPNHLTGQPLLLWCASDAYRSVPKMATWSLFTLSLLSVHSVIGLILRNLQDALVRVRQENAARLQAEATLRESERKFRNIAGNIPGMVYQLRVRNNGSTHFSYVSPRAAELFGFPADLSSPDWEMGALVHPDDRESFSASIAQAIAACSDWNYEGRIVTPRGAVKCFRGIASPVRIGDELAFDGVLLDITERVRAEQAMRRASRLVPCAGAVFTNTVKPADDVGEAIWIGKEDLPRIWDELHDDTKRLLEIAKVI